MSPFFVLALVALQQAPGSPLQRRLDAASPGDTIRLAPGEHEGPAVIRTRITLLGEPGAVIDGRGRATALQIEADSVEVRGLRVVGGGRTLNSDDAALKLVRCTGCVVADNVVERSLHGIYLLETTGAVVRGNRIEGDTTRPEARRGNGIHLFHSTGTVVERNTVRRTRDGIYFSFASGNRVEDNDVAHVRYGLHYMYSDDNVFHRNRFTRNAAGAAIMFSRRILFRENTFAEHVGYRAYGILLQTAYEVTARRNRIERNLVGVFLDMSSGNTFLENAIVGNGTGFDLIPSAEDNVFTGNVIAGNRVAVRQAVGGGRNTWATGGRGNYWGDRRIFDLDGDGIGDRPYRVGDPFSGLAALNPALEVFAGSPAARALSWAEQAFPVFDLPAAEDPAPLVRPPAAVPFAEGRTSPMTDVAGSSALWLLALVPPGLWLGRRALRPHRRART